MRHALPAGPPVQVVPLRRQQSATSERTHAGALAVRGMSLDVASERPAKPGTFWVTCMATKEAPVPLASIWHLNWTISRAERAPRHRTRAVLVDLMDSHRD